MMATRSTSGRQERTAQCFSPSLLQKRRIDAMHTSRFNSHDLHSIPTSRLGRPIILLLPLILVPQLVDIVIAYSRSAR
jgi:hypothetical protein